MRRAPALLLLAFACAALPRAARAATLDDYRARVRAAYRTVEELWQATDPAGETPGRAQLEWESQLVARLRTQLPAAERVERAGGAVAVDNSWLHKELDAYAAFPPDKMKEKEDKLALLGERLRALGAQLDAEAAATAARDKEAEKGRLQGILRRPEYKEQASKGGALEALWDWIVALLRRLLPEQKPMQPGTANVLALVARIFVYALAVGLIVFVVWRYGPYAWGRFGARRRGKREREARVVLGEQLRAGQSASDLISEAEALARAGDLRAAIRKAYIGVLCDLGDRHLIRLAQHKTNRDYLTSLRPRPDLYGTMRPLTTSFERHWYGLAPATDADWAEYRSLCRQAIQSGV